MEITASVTNQDRDPCYLHLPLYFTHTLLVRGKIKRFCDHCFPEQIRPQNTVQLLPDYFSVRIGFIVNNKRQSLPIVYIMLV